MKTKTKEKEWFYTDEVKDHFFNPRNILKEDQEKFKKKANGVGSAGSPVCGDLMKLWIKVKDGRIKECKFQTFGCASAIASTSVLTEMVTENKGMKIKDALKIKPQDIVKRLGSLPEIKFHCSVLGDRALKEAINDYLKKNQKDL